MRSVLRRGPLRAILASAALGPAALSFPTDAPAQAEGATAEAAYQDAVRRGRTLVEALMDLSAIPGIAVAVAVDGRIVWSEGFGKADLENPAAVTPATRFRLASTSKAVTASAAARLAQEGRLDLDAPISRYLPDLPSWGDAVTARQLAGHLAGIRGYTAEDQRPCCDIDRRHYPTTADALSIFVDDSPVAAPGAEYRYSTFGYTLLGGVMEAACGAPFPACLRRTLLDPLDLPSIGPDRRDSLVAGRTEYFERDAEGVPRPADYVDPSYKWAGGGLLSTAVDLARFGSAHLGPGFFDERSLEALFTPQTTLAGEATGVGLGWRVGRDGRGHRLAWHAGNMSGARSVVLIDRDRRGVVALLANASLAPYLVESTAQALLDPFLDPSPAEGLAGAETAGLRGTFAYRLATEDRDAAEVGDAADTGILSIRPDGPPFGSMTLPAGLAAIREHGVPTPECLPVVHAETRGGVTAAVVVTSAGALTLLLETTEAGFRGRSVGLFAERSLAGTPDPAAVACEAASG